MGSVVGCVCAAQDTTQSISKPQDRSETHPFCTLWLQHHGPCAHRKHKEGLTCVCWVVGGWGMGWTCVA